MLGGIVDQDLFDVAVEQVADHLERDVGLAVEQRGRGHRLAALALRAAQSRRSAA